MASVSAPIKSLHAQCYLDLRLATHAKGTHNELVAWKPSWKWQLNNDTAASVSGACCSKYLQTSLHRAQKAKGHLLLLQCVHLESFKELGKVWQKCCGHNVVLPHAITQHGTAHNCVPCNV